MTNTFDQDIFSDLTESLEILLGFAEGRATPAVRHQFGGDIDAAMRGGSVAFWLSVIGGEALSKSQRETVRALADRLIRAVAFTGCEVGGSPMFALSNWTGRTLAETTRRWCHQTYVASLPRDATGEFAANLERKREAERLEAQADEIEAQHQTLIALPDAAKSLRERAAALRG